MPIPGELYGNIPDPTPSNTPTNEQVFMEWMHLVDFVASPQTAPTYFNPRLARGE